MQEPVPRLQAGGREPSAKQKAFGTAFATATSPASYLASKNRHVSRGGFFDAWTKCGRGGLEAGYHLHFLTELLFPVYREVAPSECRSGWHPNEPATSGLTKTTFSWKSRSGKLLLERFRLTRTPRPWNYSASILWTVLWFPCLWPIRLVNEIGLHEMHRASDDLA